MTKPRHSKSVTDAKITEFFGRHLRYEIEMLRATYLLSQSVSDSQLLLNIYIESFTIHARNIIMFFKNKKEYCDFDPKLFTNNGYNTNRQFIDTNLVEKINQQIVHLSAKRTSIPSEKIGSMHRRRIMEAIEAEIARFEQSLKEEYKPTWSSISELIFVSEQSVGASNEITTCTTSAPNIFAGEISITLINDNKDG